MNSPPTRSLYVLCEVHFSGFASAPLPAASNAFVDGDGDGDLPPRPGLSLSFAVWSLIIGALLISMALSGTFLRRLPLSAAMLYLAAGYGLGPGGWALMAPDPIADSVILEKVTEAAVLISLFSVGLKLGLPLSDRVWRLPVRLAVVSMTITVALIAGVAMLALWLSLGAAVLLGAILAPTDPVLASDVQVVEASDRDSVRFSLTGEGGLNDGAAFPFVMLGLGGPVRPARLGHGGLVLARGGRALGDHWWLADRRRVGRADREAGGLPAQPSPGVRRTR